MKKVLLIILLIFVVFLIACDKKDKELDSWEHFADKKNEALSLYNDFMKETLKSTNFKISFGFPSQTESTIYEIDSTTAKVTLSSVTLYAYIKDNKYYCGSVSESDGKSLTESRSEYENLYNEYMQIFNEYKRYIKRVDDESNTFVCEIYGRKYLSKGIEHTEETLSLKIRKYDNYALYVIIIDAKAIDGLVTNYTRTAYGPGVSPEHAYIHEALIEYGNVNIVIPEDLHWYLQLFI